MATVIDFPAREPLGISTEPIRRFSVDEYHSLINADIFDEDDGIELLEGYLVEIMPKNPRHTAILTLIQFILARILPDDYHLSIQNPMTTGTSEPEPNLMVLRGRPLDFINAHPGPADIALVMEISDSSLQRDRTTKLRIFAEAGVTTYWIVNLQDNQIEVYTQPASTSTIPDYQQRQTYRQSDIIPINLDDTEVASLPVRELLA